MFFTLLLPSLLASASPAAPDAALLAELNAARSDPRAYAARLRRYRTYFRGSVVYYPGRPEGLLTQEGVRAVDEAIAFLERQRPLAPLATAPVLARAAADHIAEQGPLGAVGHVSRDGITPGRRVIRRGGGLFVAETITYGPARPEEVVRQLIVDDGVPGRGHRSILFAPDMRFAGSACGPHRIYRTMCVIDFGRTIDGR